MGMFFFPGIMTGSFYSVSTLLNQMIITYYEVRVFISFVLLLALRATGWTSIGFVKGGRFGF